LALLHRSAEDGRLTKIWPWHYHRPAASDDLIVTGKEFRELSPGGSVWGFAYMPAHIQQLLAPGRRYELIWPGAEISLWDWGTLKEHEGLELKPTWPSLVVLGGSRVSFNTLLPVPRPPPIEAPATV
jgi:hypothetical protein